jgi:hypothetical protein
VKFILQQSLFRQKYSKNIFREIGGSFMEFMLQFGYGMMDHSRSMVKSWKGGTVILSPRDLSPKQLINLSSEILKLHGEVLFDPQFYLPHSDHERLCSHEYWPNDYTTLGFWGGAELSRMLKEIKRLNDTLSCKKMILPGQYASVINDDWINFQQMTFEEAERLEFDSASLLATIALSNDSIRDADQVHKLLEASNDWKVKGVYLICEHPNGDYLVGDPVWLANVLDLIAGLRLKGKYVILGYCNQQLLIAANSAVNAIASGTWMNVRSFPPDKFRKKYEDEIKQRAVWYYCPSALSEFKISFLDIAQRRGVLELLLAEANYNSPVNSLFVGHQIPSTVFSEKQAFRHFLHCFKVQAEGYSRKNNFRSVNDFYKSQLDQAQSLLERLRVYEIKGQHRDMYECIDACRSALGVLEQDRGAMLRRYSNIFQNI